MGFIQNLFNSDDTNLQKIYANLLANLVERSNQHPYIITLDRNSPKKIDYEKMKLTGVIGAIIEGGYLYSDNIFHTKVTSFRNPNFASQVTSIQNAKLDFGIYFVGRAKNITEASKEIYELSFLIRKYFPKLGIWVQLSFPSTNSKTTNNKILNKYKEELESLGLKGSIGIITTLSKLKSINWLDHSDSWILWIQDHIKDVDDKSLITDSKFFNISKDYL